jgi:CheY-like chemotaxis protein
VDDEQLIAYTLSVILLRHGYRTFWFTEAVCALDAAATHCPALLVTDFNMPSMSGFELADAMRNICPECQVLVISAQFGNEQSEEVARSRRQEVVMIGKPVGVDQLLSCVAKLVTTDQKPSENLP